MKWLLFFSLTLVSTTVFSQTSSFTYAGSMTFDISDSLVAPYLCAVDSSGDIWVVSTSSVSASAINGLFEAAPSDTSFHLVVQFADSDSVRDVTGLAVQGNDVFVSARMMPPAGYSSPYYYPYSEILYLSKGNPSGMEIFKQPKYKDYGTWYNGITISKDGYIYYGQSYLVTIGTIDGRNTSSDFGNTLGFAYTNGSTPMEPGGGLTNPNALNQIRTIALNPDSSYSSPTAVVFTSRNSSTDPGGSGTGGIAAWTGGTESNPLGYKAVRITDISGFLKLGTSTPYGISIDPRTGYLFVCGTDSSRKWVKGFDVSGSFATQADELPSSTSQDVKFPNGAPFVTPSDVAFNSTGQIAYVTDEGAKRVFKFESTATAVVKKPHNLPENFVLRQNYPNPFNPTTKIVFEVQSEANVKVEVFNILGQRVATLASGSVAPGTHVLTFDGSRFASGLYICRVTVGSQIAQIKMILLK